MMAVSKTFTSYQYDDFIKYKEPNNMLPQELVEYCVTETNNLSPDINIFSDCMRDIISSITKGDNPNNLIFRNLIKSYINTINQSNYPEYLQKLKNLEFSSYENIYCLCNELIICAIRFPSAIKGFTFQEDPKVKSIPEICTDIAKQFSSFEIQTDTKKIKFYEEFIKICQKYFSDFVDLNKAMDEHNENTSDNYKGFMTFIGLLYSRGVINIKVVIECMDLVKRTLFAHICDNPHQSESHKCTDYTKKLTNNACNKSVCYYDCESCMIASESKHTSVRKHTEYANFHKGYEHLINHMIHSLKTRIPELLDTLREKEANLKLVLSDNCDKFLQQVIVGVKFSLFLPSHTNLDEVCEGYDHLCKVVCAEEIPNVIKSIKAQQQKILNEAVQINKKYVLNLTEYMNTIICNHQDMISMQTKYMTSHKSQLIPPFRPYMIITHNSIGTLLNELVDTIEKSTSYVLKKYEPQSVSIAKNN